MTSSEPASSAIDAPFEISSTEIGVIADQYVARYWDVSPLAASAAGVPGYDHLLDDLSPRGDAARLALIDEFLPRVRQAVANTPAERTAVAVMLNDLEAGRHELVSATQWHAWGVITSVVSALLQTYALMDVTTQRDALLARVAAVDAFFQGWYESLTARSARGVVNSRHATNEVITQLRQMSASGMHIALLKDANPDELAVLKAADRAMEELAARLESEYLPLCRESLAVSADVYPGLAAAYLGAEIDLLAAYEAAQVELAAINDEMRVLARAIYPDEQDPANVPHLLDNDPRYLIPSATELKARIEAMFADALLRLADDFIIPDEIRRCDVVMDETSMDASPYYLGPSDDLTRAGAMCYPVANREAFPLWREVSTVYHESIPGHHLQVALAVTERANLTSFQRSLSWNCGHGEGWALYAERVMDMLGFLTDPADRLGYLISRALRIARVVIDIGLHMELTPPFGGTWTYENTVKYLMESAWLQEEYACSEINRYIAWPGQAITYKIGEGYWVAARERAIAAGCPLPEFHDRVLRAGSVPLALLEQLADEACAEVLAAHS